MQEATASEEVITSLNSETDMSRRPSMKEENEETVLNTPRRVRTPVSTVDMQNKEISENTSSQTPRRSRTSSVNNSDNLNNEEYKIIRRGRPSPVVEDNNKNGNNRI